MTHIVHHFDPDKLEGRAQDKTALLINPPVYDTQSGMNANFSISWDAVSQLLRYQSFQPDEEDL